MQVIGLVSGGKDSIYNLLECQRLGHHVVCIANLHPPIDGEDSGATIQELDSYMFYTVGHTAIEALGAAIGVPLVRRPTQGKAVSTGVQYDAASSSATGAGAKEDEVEDMFELLRECKRMFPEAQAVSSGAILSSYQRTRVENVCSRLGMVSLGYMWRRRQPPLLRDMITSGLDAVLIKVASYGLKPSHVGQSIAGMAEHLLEGEGSFGLNPCGEGGEYETFCRYCPGLFKRGRVEFVRHERIDRSKDEFAPDSHMAILEARAVSVPGGEPLTPLGLPMESKAVGASGPATGCGAASSTPSGPPSSAASAAASPESAEEVAAAATPSCSASRDAADSVYVSVSTRTSKDASFHVVACFNGIGATGSAAGAAGRSIDGKCGSALPSASQQIGALLRAAGARIHAERRDSELGSPSDLSHDDVMQALADAVYVRLVVRDMARFKDINSEYCKYFRSFPPSRSCIQCGMPGGSGDVAVSVRVHPGSGASVARGDKMQREVLHVRSWSRWAPSCIGPYAQANRSRGAVLLAGQIGLVPETMQMVGGGCIDQVKLLMRSNGRVLHAMGSSLDLLLGGVLFKATCDAPGVKSMPTGGLASSIPDSCEDGAKGGAPVIMTDADLVTLVQAMCGCGPGDKGSDGTAFDGELDESGSVLSAAMAAHRAAGVRMLSADRAGWAEDEAIASDAIVSGPAAGYESLIENLNSRELGPDFDEGVKSGCVPDAWSAESTAGEAGLLPLVVATVGCLPRAALAESELCFASKLSVQDPDWLDDEPADVREAGLGVQYSATGPAVDSAPNWHVAVRGVRRGAGLVAVGIRMEPCMAADGMGLAGAAEAAATGIATLAPRDGEQVAVCSCSLLFDRTRCAVDALTVVVNYLEDKAGKSFASFAVPCDGQLYLGGAGVFDVVLLVRTEANRS